MSEIHQPVKGEADPFAPLGGLNGHAHEEPPKKRDEEWQPSRMPVMVPAPKLAELYHPELGQAVAMWEYRDAQACLLFVVARFEKQIGEKLQKDVTPFCHGRRVWTDRQGRPQDQTRWHMKAPAAPIPLYGLQFLAARPNDPVLLVEGEKSAEAARLRFPGYVVIASQGGSNKAKKTDWRPLHRRKVVAWPDQDDAGRRYANDAAAMARPGRGPTKAASFSIVQVPREWPEGWDLADDLPEAVSDVLLSELLEEAIDADPPELPPGYVFRDSGLWFEAAQDPDAETLSQPFFVTAPFEVVGEANDGTGMAWGLVIRWKDRDGRQHQWSVPKRLVHSDGSRIAEELEDAGLHCSPSGRAKTLLRNFIGGVRSKRRLICVDRTGWHTSQGRSVFILPGGEAFGPAAGSVILQTDHAGTDGAFIPAGGLADWKQHVAAFAVGNHRLALAICTALATPLLDVVGGDSGGFHIVGMSQTGKSTTLYVAGSVWGKGTRGAQVRQWRATANGLESAASETSDTALILDEMGQASAADVADTIYMLANGAGKLRAGKEGGARRTKTWRTMFLSTGEITLAAKLAEAQRKVMAGLEVRLVNMPADAGCGMGVFQNLHGLSGPNELAKHLQLQARTHYGTAGRAFLTQLVRARVSKQRELEARVKGAQASFAKAYVPDDAAGQVRSVADRFALVAVAGEMATEWGILPWPKGEATRAAAESFKTWLRERGGAGTTEDQQAISQVQAFLEAHGESRFTPLVRQDTNGNPEAPPAEVMRTHNRAGWRRRPKNERDGWEYLILPQTFTSEVCKGLDPKRVAAVLLAQGLLVVGKDRKSAKLEHIPGEGPIRVYRVSGAILGMREEVGDEEEE
ncbi:DUF927 domain-containing protein [Pararoseomonas indoligenes]|uniref:DUF927 domain-containing protein n=1 Tax=Roseomonas indoligenes TaxID=2820811 RepID=A0A940MYN1_9PROT|nr:DUF927 domain-containing protein [Pararoseomonas indoligenes]MBP0492856.1 DUF927 domain-containing protein [Pararoseomonas indoligenes]